MDVEGVSIVDSILLLVDSILLLVDSILLLVDSILLLVDSKLLLVDSKLLLVDSILLLVDSKLLLVEICGVDKHHPMGGIHSCILLLNELLHTQVFHHISYLLVSLWSLGPSSSSVTIPATCFSTYLVRASKVYVHHCSPVPGVCVCVCKLVSNSSMQIL